MGDAGVQALAAADLSNLRVLELCQTGVGNAGARALANPKVEPDLLTGIRDDV